MELDPKRFNKGDSGPSIYRDDLKKEPGKRRAKCSYCTNTMIAREDIPFFRETPKRDFDEYYCGCLGWD